jgi:hypothetical protein
MTKKKPVDPDPRAAEMTEEALSCRANGGRHAYEPLAKALRRARIGTARSAVVERFCIGECGVSVVEEYSLVTRERAGRKPGYPKEGYLTPKNSGGRMAAADATASLLNRIFG